jgi:hypothetical protein
MMTYTIAEVGEVLEMPSGALHGFIQAGLLAVTEVGCRRLVTGDAVLAFVPQKRRDEVRARLDDVELRRGGGRGQG